MFAFAGTVLSGSKLEAQVMAREVVEIVNGMLGQSNEMVGFFFLERIGMDGDLDRDGGSASLARGEENGQP